MTPLEDHPIASIFPLLPEHELSALTEDVKQRGVEIPIVLYEGKILDGRNRYRAAMASGAHFTTNYYTGGDALNYVLSLNLHRRHLSESQRAMVAAKISTLERGGDTRSDQSADLRNGKISQPQAAEMLNVGTRTVQEAKTILRDAPERVAEVERGEKTVHAVASEIKPHVTHNSGSMEWYTPAAYVELAREVMGAIDLDPASCEHANVTVKATRFFTAQNSGLEQNWSGRVWLNPPYESGLIQAFVEKLLLEKKGAVSEAIILTNNATETSWGTALLSACDAVCFPRRRIKFLTEKGEVNTPLQGQMICYFGPNPQKFKQVYEREPLGPVKF